jgi:hypothetical protein
MDALVVQIDPDRLKSSPGVLDGKWETNISQPHDTNRSLSTLE